MTKRIAIIAIAIGALLGAGAAAASGGTTAATTSAPFSFYHT